MNKAYNDRNIDIPALRKRFVEMLGEDGNRYPVHLEQQFPRIMEKIVNLWGSPEADAYFRDLTTTTRHDRQGFPEDVARELFYLSTIHGRLGLEENKGPDFWGAG